MCVYICICPNDYISVKFLETKIFKKRIGKDIRRKKMRFS